MNIVDRYTVNCGSSLNLNNNPRVEIDGEFVTFSSYTLSDVTSGSNVDLLDFRKVVPTNAVKMAKYTSSDRVLAIFLDSSNNAISPAYLVRPREDSIVFNTPTIIDVDVQELR